MNTCKFEHEVAFNGEVCPVCAAVERGAEVIDHAVAEYDQMAQVSSRFETMVIAKLGPDIYADFMDKAWQAEDKEELNSQTQDFMSELRTILTDEGYEVVEYTTEEIAKEVGHEEAIVRSTIKDMWPDSIKGNKVSPYGYREFKRTLGVFE
jgi:hypothetical protein